MCFLNNPGFELTPKGFGVMVCIGSRTAERPLRAVGQLIPNATKL